MPKVPLTEVQNPENQSSFVAALNANFEAIEDAFEEVLFRNGTAPNEMDADFDANGQAIINLPLPTLDTEPVRKGEFDAVSDNIASANEVVGEGLAELEAGLLLAVSYVEDAETAATEAEAAVIEAEAAADAAKLYDFAIFLEGKPGPAEVLLQIVMNRSGTIAATGHQAVASVASTGTAVIDVELDGSPIGTITFTSSATGVVSISATPFVAGDILTLVAPDPVDATLEDISITLQATRA